MSSLFTQDEINDLRSEVITGELPDTVTIYRPPNPATADRKPSGAIDDTYPTKWQTVASAVKCRIDGSRSAGSEKVGAGAVQAVGSYDVSFAWNTVIDETCRFRVTASLYNPTLVGRDFDVKEASMVSWDEQRLVRATKTAL